jgi:hypothetical protein
MLWMSTPERCRRVSLIVHALSTRGVNMPRRMRTACTEHAGSEKTLSLEDTCPQQQHLAHWFTTRNLVTQLGSRAADRAAINH